MDLANLIPTDGELKAFIEKIAAIIEKFFELFENLSAGLQQTFRGYNDPVYGELIDN